MKVKSINIDKEMIDFAKKESYWDLGNQTLYDLCQINPKHETYEVIISKLWLIGRAYSTAIERRKNAIGTTSEFYRSVAKNVRQSELDDLLNKLPKKIVEPWHELGPAITTHKRLVEVFRELTGLNNRYLASKYLHFHMPNLFFIYDSRAAWAIKKVVPSLKGTKTFSVDNHVDPEYNSFCRRCQSLRDWISEHHGMDLTPREIDNILLSYG